MLAGDFARNLRKLNSNLRIFCGDDPRRAAGLYYAQDGQYIDIMGVDKNWVPEHTEFAADGRIKKGGWRRVLKELIYKKLVDRFAAQRVFGTTLEYGDMPHWERIQDPVLEAIEEAKRRGRQDAIKKGGNPDKTPGIDYYKLDDLLEIHRMRRQS